MPKNHEALQGPEASRLRRPFGLFVGEFVHASASCKTFIDQKRSQNESSAVGGDRAWKSSLMTVRSNRRDLDTARRVRPTFDLENL